MARIAAVQLDPRLGDKESNLQAIERYVAEAAGRGVELAVFPECAVTGYMFESLDEARQVAEPVPGPATDRIAQAAAKHGLYVIAGTLERVNDRCYNTAILAGPNGLETAYRKTHTLCLGVDRFTTPGDIPYHVVELPFGRVGILICYDLRFPEAARTLALQGAQIIALPTNWPSTSRIQADVFSRARAAENRVFVVASDRVGEERWARFLGRSQIVAPDGSVLQEASPDRVEVIIRDVDPAEADRKKVVVRPGEHEMDCLGDRRPELYEELVWEADVAASR
jgi:predicted amidohydrolase